MEFYMICKDHLSMEQKIELLKSKGLNTIGQNMTAEEIRINDIAKIHGEEYCDIKCKFSDKGTHQWHNPESKCWNCGKWIAINYFYQDVFKSDCLNSSCSGCLARKTREKYA
jgi:hypothetical protein